MRRCFLLEYCTLQDPLNMGTATKAERHTDLRNFFYFSCILSTSPTAMSSETAKSTKENPDPTSPTTKARFKGYFSHIPTPSLLLPARLLCLVVALTRQRTNSKASSEYFDPCQDAAAKSIRCLNRNPGDRDLCQDYFQYVSSSQDMVD